MTGVTAHVAYWAAVDGRYNKAAGSIRPIAIYLENKIIIAFYLAINPFIA